MDNYKVSVKFSCRGEDSMATFTYFGGPLDVSRNANKFMDANRDFTDLLERSDYHFASLTCLLHSLQQRARSNGKSKQEEEINEMEAKLTIAESDASEFSLLLTGIVNWHLGNSKTALNLLNKPKLFNNNNNVEHETTVSVTAQNMIAWISLTSIMESEAERRGDHSNDFILDIFNGILSKNPKNYEAILGKMEFYKRRGKFELALQESLLLITARPGSTGATSSGESNLEHYFRLWDQAEQMQLYLCGSQWDQAVRVANTILSRAGQQAMRRLSSSSPHDYSTGSQILDPANFLEAKIVLALNELVQVGGRSKALELVNETFRTLNLLETRNAEKALLITGTFARCVMGSSSGVEVENLQHQILQACCQNLNNYRAVAMTLGSTLSSSLFSEMGSLHLQMRKYGEAKEFFNRALDLDPTNYESILGNLQISIESSTATGSTSSFEQQIELVREECPFRLRGRMCYLEALCANGGDSHWRLLQKAVKVQFEVCNRNYQGGVILEPLVFYKDLNANLLLLILAQFEKYYFPSSSPAATEEDSDLLLMHQETLTPALILLENLQRSVPGCLYAILCLAKLKYLMGELNDAANLADRILKTEDTFSQAHLLQAQILLEQKNFRKALNALDAGVAANFEVRKLPLYSIIRARVLKELGQGREALSLLEELNNNAKSISLSSKDRELVYCELAELYCNSDNEARALSFIQEGKRLFASEPRVLSKLLVLQVQVLIQKGDFDNALSVLSSVPSTSGNSFVEAKKRMANIYLNQKNNIKEYQRCFQELVEVSPSVETYSLLGDSFLTLNDPESAISIYSQALNLFPESISLASQIGRALIQTHDYGRAIKYLRAAVSEAPLESELYVDLANLFLDLGQTENCVSLVKRALSHESSDDIALIKRDIELLQIASKAVHLQSGSKTANSNEFEESLRLLEMARELANSWKENQGIRILLAELNYKMGRLCMDFERFDRAKGYLDDSLLFLSSDKRFIHATVELSLKIRDFDTATTNCTKLLRLEPQNITFLYLMARVLYETGDINGSIEQIKALLNIDPLHEESLILLIEAYWRTAKLEDLKELAERTLLKPKSISGGLGYCRGLYYRYINDPSSALKEFNASRSSMNWKERSIFQMIEIFLNPDNETIGGEMLQTVTDLSESGGLSATEQVDSEMLAILMTERLLKELAPTFAIKSKRHQVYEWECMLASRQKELLEQAITALEAFIEREGKYLPAVVALATGYTLVKQNQKSKSILLSCLSTCTWSMQDASSLERAWLLLADLHLQTGGESACNAALDILNNKIIHFNASCVRAYDYLGFIKEREGDYKAASLAYAKAFALERESNPSMGYKLAFTHLKARKFFEAIDVCHSILIKYPEYPKVRREILEKAQSSIKLPFNSN